MKTMRISLLTYFLFFLYSASFAQTTPENFGWKQSTIVSKEMGTINYYITSKKLSDEKPVLLYLDGSGAFPLFQRTSRGTGSTVVFDYKKLAEKYHIILISKPGVPFIDSVEMDKQTGYPIYKTPEEYTRRLSLDWRVNAADTVLKEVLSHYKVKKEKIAILGVSEGFQVGAKLMAVNKSITHSILLVGNGLSQFYDFIIQNRQDAQAGMITAEQAQQNIDSLQAKFRDIYANSQSTDKEWYGHTYLRWSSFSNSQPLDHIFSRDIPVYIVACSKDRNTSVLSTDYLYLESARLQKKNLIYKVLPYDHSFTETLTDKEGNVLSRENHMKEVINGALEWLDKSPGI